MNQMNMGDYSLQIWIMTYDMGYADGMVELCQLKVQISLMVVPEGGLHGQWNNT